MAPIFYSVSVWLVAATWCIWWWWPSGFGKILGIIIGTSAVSGLIGPILGGWAFDTYGSSHSIWLVFCGMAWLGVAVTMRIKPPHDMEII
jgi:hypothetical protein